MSEFKDMVKDTQLETPHLRFDVMCNMCVKLGALGCQCLTPSSTSRLQVHQG